MIYDMSADQRLLSVARDAISGYRQGEISLKRLVNRLDDVWNNLVTSSWSDEFRSHWWTLEQVYAVALDRGQLEALPEDTVIVIDSAMRALERLLNSWPDLPSEKPVE